VNVLSSKAQILKEYVEWTYNSLNETIKGLDEQELKWHPTPESNNIEWTLNHLSRISNLSLPRIMKGDPNYKPFGWPDDYKDREIGFDKLLSDIAQGKALVLNEINKLTDEQLEADIPLWGGTRKRKIGLFAYIGELIHHRGQIAFIRGTIKRKREKDPNFLC
jgi:uncharacterized damage-inducible protein DinB